MSQDEFGSLLEVKKSHISLIESGHRDFTSKHLALLKLKIPKLSVHWLQTGEGLMFEDEQLSTGTDLANPDHYSAYMAEIRDACAAYKIKLEDRETQEFILRVSEAAMALLAADIDLDKEVNRHGQLLHHRVALALRNGFK